jgi:nitrite reductase/ring-hydroxylating ferredoxin subunit
MMPRGYIAGIGGAMRDTVFTDEFFASLETSLREVNSAETLPPLCYTSPEFYEFEKDAIFHREWLCVGREAWVRKPGDYFTTSHVGEPIVVVRGRDATLRAMSTVCRHRAALVVEGHGSAHSFRCPYHHWTYSLEGRLIGAPAMDRACEFEMSRIGLAEFKVEAWLGFIFVNFAADAAPLAPRLAALTQVLEHYDVATGDELSEPAELRKEPWNWKVRYENSNDGYHANRLHAGPVHDNVPSALASFPDLPADTAGYFRFNGTVHPDFSFNPTLKALLPISPRLAAEDRQRYLFLCVPPSLTFNVGCDFLSFNIFHVDSPREMSSRRGWVVAPGARAHPLFDERLKTLVSTFLPITEQDRHIDKLVQIGLQSKFAVRGRYSWQEQSQRELNGWLVERYRACWEKRNSPAKH